MESTGDSFEINLKDELRMLAAFGANIADAHSCFIFFPQRFISMLRGNDASSNDRSLRVVGYHSLCESIDTAVSVDITSGLIGWVAQNSQSIHVSPFERDATTLKVYSQDIGLKSLIAVPINLLKSGELALTGVLLCDSRKSFAFSKIQGKLLEDLAHHIATIAKLSYVATRTEEQDLTWAEFAKGGEALFQTLGARSVEVLRLIPENISDIERSLGVPRAIDLLEQITRLIHQSLPPPKPVFRLPDGGILLVVDSMMSAFYENKARILCEHVSPRGSVLRLVVRKASLRDLGVRECSLDDLIRATAAPLGPVVREDVKYERNWA